MAKPSPSLPPPSLNIIVFIPTRLPSISTSGPPLFPGLRAASVWMYTLGSSGSVRRGRRQDDSDALRSLHHVSISNDVAVRIDDDASANRMLPHDSCCIAMSVILQGAVASNHDLHHRG